MWTAEEVAARLKVAVSTVYSWKRRGLIKMECVAPQRYMVTEEEVNRLKTLLPFRVGRPRKKKERGRREREKN